MKRTSFTLICTLVLKVALAQQSKSQGANFVVNGNADGWAQSAKAIAADKSGNFIIVWGGYPS
ncbi:MAG: hypothetical protein EHM72_08625 [Calditrichaeota bacterium]|nr:MAG: hypothetical protein EHM72_08625 [Calditrichota bacterium]